MLKRYLFVLLLGLFSVSCEEKGGSKAENRVVVRVKKFPTTLNYMTSNSQVETLIQKHTFSRLLWYDKNGALKPFLVKNIPVAKRKDDHFDLEYELRQEALWPNGERITSQDVAFSLKVFKLPISNSINTQLYLKRAFNIEKSNVSDRVFSISVYGNSEEGILLTGDFDILQKSKYDPEGLLDHVTLESISSNPKNVAKDKNVQEFLTEFLANNFKFKGEYLRGSGPYSISNMEHGKYIHLKKNKGWWAEALSKNMEQFQANPEEIVYMNITEPLVAIQALRTGNIDVMSEIPSSEFDQLSQDSSFLKSFNLFSPLNYRFTYIGLNSRIQYLNNINLRRAVAYLIKPDDIIRVVEMGYGEATIGPINPIKDFYYNRHISHRSYNPLLAQEMFLKNGFKLIDNKLIDKKTNKALELKVSYRQNPNYESIAFLLKEEASRIGLKLNLVQYEGRTISKMARNHDFEIMIGSFSGEAHSFNFDALFSQEAAKINGLNFTGFGNDRSDSLIQAANYAEDSISKRQALFALQEELYEEATMLFLYFSKNKIAINKKFDNLKISTTKPGYDVTSFILKDSTNSN